MRVTPKLNKSANYLGCMSKDISRTKDDKDIEGHQARSSSFLKMCTSEVLLSHPENSTDPDH